MKDMQEQIDEIMDNFDFDRVHKAMVALDWRWGHDEVIPEKYELRKQARSLLKTVWKSSRHWKVVATGGFFARCELTECGEKLLSLSFQIDEWSNEEDEKREKGLLHSLA